MSISWYVKKLTRTIIIITVIVAIKKKQEKYKEVYFVSIYEFISDMRSYKITRYYKILRLL